MKKVETLWQLLLFVQEQFKLINYANTFADALAICEFVSKEKRESILIYGNQYKINKRILKKTKYILKKIFSGEPLSYILKYCNFYGNKFYINKNVFIPRSDTECLIEYIIKYINKKNLCSNNKKINILDLCCGSGCIGLTLALNVNCDVLSVDISKKALKLAYFNAKMFHLENKIKFLNLDILKQHINNNIKFDIIVCNPPYIAHTEKIEKSVLDFEPKVALFAKNSGLIFYKHIIENYKKNMKKNSLIAFECGYLQSNLIFDMFIEKKYININVIKDLSQINRIISANI